ncbi:MAG: hypothetical protein E7365_07600 [Clostridiales bacterium]|nr:hypothetical protein [Clostridiales bacterium]
MKKIIALLCLVLLFTGCNNGIIEENLQENIVKENIKENIAVFSKRFTCRERPLETPEPEDLPEGSVVYDDEASFSPRNQENLHINSFLYTKLNLTNIDYIYEGDILHETYVNACEWISTLYEAEKLSNAGKMRANIQHRYNLLNEQCKNFVEKEFIDNHILDMYHSNDIKNCSLSYVSDGGKFSFERYITTYTDSEGNNYYGITAQVKLNSLLYSRVRQMPYYVTSRDMQTRFYVEVIFDEHHKIAGWQEEYFKHSENQKDYGKRYVISPKGVEKAKMPDYFEVILDESAYGRQTAEAVPQKKEMAGFVKDLIYVLNDTPTNDFNEHTFDSLKSRCSDKLVNSTEIIAFYNEFISDIKKYNIDFEFGPLYLKSLDDTTPSVSMFTNSIYGDLYSFSTGGLVETGSQEFNDKYGLRQDEYSFDAEMYFVIEDKKPYFIGAVLNNYFTFQNEMPENVKLGWQGIELPPEEQG